MPLHPWDNNFLKRPRKFRIPQSKKIKKLIFQLGCIKMALNTHYRVEYADAVRQLAGFQYQAKLPTLVDQDSKQGEAVFFDTMAPLDAATLELMTAGNRYRKEYEAIGSPVLSDLENILTPHMEVTRDRTIVYPYRNEIGHTFRTPDEIAQNSNPTSRTLKNLMSRINVQRDNLVLTALNEMDVSRGKDQGSLSTDSLPAGQQLNITDGQMDKEVLNEVRSIFEDNYIEDEQICMIITPTMKKELIDNSGATIHSSDFVYANQLHNFEKGQLPEIYGITLIVHPLASSYNTSNSLTWDSGVAHAFCKSGIVYNTFRGLETKIDELPSQRFQTGLYISEFVACKRLDDKKVLHVQMGTGS